MKNTKEINNLEILSDIVDLDEINSFNLGKGRSMYIGSDYQQMDGRFDEACEWLEEAKELIKQNSIDSLLRYFQTGVIGGEHLPSIVLQREKTIQRMLAKKMESILDKIGLRWNQTELDRQGKMVFEYIKEEYTLEFATVNPFERTIVFHFDFIEMEREREILHSKISHKIRETIERYKDTKSYLDDNSGIKKIRNKKTLERLRENNRNIGQEIDDMDKEIAEINKQKELLEDIKSMVPDMEYHLRKFGFVFEYVKGEQYEV